MSNKEILELKDFSSRASLKIGDKLKVEGLGPGEDGIYTVEHVIEYKEITYVK